MAAATIEDMVVAIDGSARPAHTVTRIITGTILMVAELVGATAEATGGNATPTPTSILVAIETQAIAILVTATRVMEIQIMVMAVTGLETIADRGLPF